jgi:hypothetical protein
MCIYLESHLFANSMTILARWYRRSHLYIYIYMCVCVCVCILVVEVVGANKQLTTENYAGIFRQIENGSLKFSDWCGAGGQFP